MTKRLIAAAALAGLALAAAPGLLRAPESALATLALAGAAHAQTAAASSEAPVEITAMTMGNPDAPVKLTEFASYTCGHCGTFHENVFKALKADYIDTGKVHFTYREVYWDRYALWAGMVARCGGESRFFGIVDMIYARQDEWSRAGQPADVAEALRRIGRVAGLDDAQLNACLSDAATAEALVEWADAGAKAAGVNATPSLVIDGELHSNMSYADLSALLDARLAAAQ